MANAVTPATTRRWQIVNKNTLNVRTSKNTRREARAAKRRTEYLFDAVTGSYAR